MASGKYYDFGKTYAQFNGNFQQQSKIALYLTGQKQKKSWLKDAENYRFFDAKQAVLEVFNKAGFHQLKEKETKHQLLSYGIDFEIKKKKIASVGLVNKKATALANLNQEVFYAEIDFDFLLNNYSGEKQFSTISKFPSVSRDLALIIEKTVSYKAVENIAKQHGGKFFQSIRLFDIFESAEKLGEGKKSYAINLTFSNSEKTLTNQEIDEQIQTLVGQFEKQLQANIRS